MAKATIHEPVGHGGRNWITKMGKQLPAYIQHVANDLIESGKTESHAIEMAVGIIKNWRDGHDGHGNKVKASTQAAAAKAWVEWEALKAENKARKLAKSTKSQGSGPTDAEFIEQEVLVSMETAGKAKGVEQSMEWVRAQISRQLNPPRPVRDEVSETYYYVRDMFSDSVIVEEEVGGKLYRYPWSVDGKGNLTLGKAEEVELDYVAKSGGELGGPIVRKDAKKQIAYAAALVPDEPDSDGDPVTAEKIEEVAHEWMANYRWMDEQHTLKSMDYAVPVESYITPAPMQVTMKGVEVELPAGSWIIGSHISDPSEWERVEKGQLGGLSIMGVNKHDYERAVANANANAATKAAGTFSVPMRRTTLKDLGPDWFAPCVSVVDVPAVPKALFFALKAKQEPAGEAERSWWEKLLGFAAKSEEESANSVRYVPVSKSDEEVIEVELTKEELQGMIDSGVENALKNAASKGSPGEAGEGEGPETEEEITAESVKEMIDSGVERALKEHPRIKELEGKLAAYKEKASEYEGFKESVEQKLRASTKSRQVEDGEGTGSSGAAPKVPEDIARATKSDGSFDTLSFLGRDSFGRKIPARQ